MIQYALKCSKGHRFDSWFQSAEAYDKLSATGMVTCAVCGCARVEKAIMTPRVRPARSTQESADAPQAESQEINVTSAPEDVKQVLAELRRKIEKNSVYVGPQFAAEARKMHLGEVPERSIYGEVKPDEAKELIEDGVPVAPLPFVPSRKTN